MSGIMSNPDGSQSGHAHSASGSTAAGMTPTTRGSYGYPAPLALDTDIASSDPYYRPPRARRMTDGDQYSPASPAEQSRGSWGSAVWAAKAGRSSQASLPQSALANQLDISNNPEWEDAYIPGGDRSSPTTTTGRGHRYTESSATVGSGRGNTDYAVREMDFYYGVRGPALSAQPARRLGTGPADPTGPVSTATSWIKQKLGLAKGKEERGFSVVRSSRAPGQLRAAQKDNLEASGAVGDAEAQIGLAISNDGSRAQRNIADDDDSDSETPNDDDNAGPSDRMLEKRPEINIEPSSPDNDPAAGGMLSRAPTVPRKSSKRKSRDAGVPPITQHLYDPPLNRSSTSRLPFEQDEAEIRREHGGSFSTTASSILDIPPHIEDGGRPASVGEVNRGRVSNVVVDERLDVRGSQAELVRGGSGSSRDDNLV